MEKFITVGIPSYSEGKYISWWSPNMCCKVIEILEKENPAYEFQQIITSPGNGGWSDFAIMKLKT
jgi:hypothetical protein